MVENCLENLSINQNDINYKIDNGELLIIFTNPNKDESIDNALKIGEYLSGEYKYKRRKYKLRIMWTDEVIIDSNSLKCDEIIKYIDKNIIAKKSMQLGFLEFCKEFLLSTLYSVLNHNDDLRWNQLYRESRNKKYRQEAKNLANTYSIDDLNETSSFIQSQIIDKKSIVSRWVIGLTLIAFIGCLLFAGVTNLVIAFIPLWIAIVAFEGAYKRLNEVGLSNEENKLNIIKMAIEEAKGKSSTNRLKVPNAPNLYIKSTSHKITLQHKAS
jgi:hypothetical protein